MVQETGARSGDLTMPLYPTKVVDSPIGLRAGPSEEIFRSLVGKLSQTPWVNAITPDSSLTETEMVAVDSKDRSGVPLMVIEYIPGDSEERLAITQPIWTIDRNRLLSREQSDALRTRWDTFSQAQGLGDITLWILDGRDTSSVAITADVELHEGDTDDAALGLVEKIRAATPQISSALTEIAGY